MVLKAYQCHTVVYEWTICVPSSEKHLLLQELHPKCAFHQKA